MAKKKKLKPLTPKQELFCQVYATEREFFGNGVQSYIFAYGIDLSKKGAYGTASVSARDNLLKPNILARINELMEDCGLSEANLDKQLAFLVSQNADLSVKRSAIAEANKLKGRIVDRSKVEIDDRSSLLEAARKRALADKD